MTKWMGSTVLAAALLLLTAGLALAVHDADLSNDEVKCQLGTSLAQGKFVAEAGKCSTKCQQGARKGANPLTDCVSPYAGAMATCVSLAQGKSEGLEQSKCAKDCPECYTGGDCTADSIARTANTIVQLNAFGPLVYCDDTASADGLSKAEAKCADTVAKTLSKFVGALGKCGQKCVADEHKGKIAPGSCAPPASDQKTITCGTLASNKATQLIDGKCAAPSGDAPECYVFDGAGWVSTVAGAVQAAYGATYCGSPSAAFLD